MIRVLIVDDEELFREGLAMDIDWVGCEMELAGTASNGNEALSMISELTPDIVITDIRMPYMDGFQFILRARQRCPEIQFIIVSGHEEFEYAQRAVRLGVSDFLLKPLDEKELNNLLLEIKVRICKNRKQLRDQKLRDSFLRMSHQAMIDEQKFYCIVILQCESKETMEGVPETVYEEIEKYTDGHPQAVLLELRNGRAILCFGENREEGLKANIRLFITAVSTNKKLREEYGFTVGVGQVKYGTAFLLSSYEEACLALKQRFIGGKNKAYFHDDLSITDENSAFKIEDLDYSDLLQAIITGNKVALQDGLSKIIKTTALMGKDAYAYGLMTVGNLFSALLKLLEELGMENQGIVQSPISLYEGIVTKETTEEMFHALKDVLINFQEHLNINNSRGNERLYIKIKNYLNSRYSMPDLSLRKVAEAFNISQGYLCSIFSDYSEETFIEYLTSLRIGKACELIVKSNYLIYEISYKVGFRNPTYFSSVFRKKMGVSPNQYRNMKKDEII